MRRVAAVSALAAWMALLGGTLVLLHSLPPATGAAGDGSAFVMAAVRYLAIGLGWYLAISTLGSSIAQLVRSQQAIDIAERVTAAPVGRLTRLALGAAFVAGALAPTAATA